MLKFKQALNAQRGSSQGARKEGAGPRSLQGPQVPSPSWSKALFPPHSPRTRSCSPGRGASPGKQAAITVALDWLFFTWREVPSGASTFQLKGVTKDNCCWPVIVLLSSAFHKFLGAHHTVIRVSSTWDLRSSHELPGFPVPRSEWDFVSCPCARRQAQTQQGMGERGTVPCRPAETRCDAFINLLCRPRGTIRSLSQTSLSRFPARRERRMRIRADKVSPGNPRGTAWRPQGPPGVVAARATGRGGQQAADTPLGFSGVGGAATPRPPRTQPRLPVLGLCARSGALAAAGRAGGRRCLSRSQQGPHLGAF